VAVSAEARHATAGTVHHAKGDHAKGDRAKGITIMHRYHFDLIATNTVTDASGAILDDDNQARKVAQKLARKVREQRPELIGQGYEILVRTEGGDEILRTAIDHSPAEGDGS
jgi:hypothetical protein